MKYFFCGNVLQEGGVPNVNRTYVKALSSSFLYVKSKNRYLAVLESVMKVLLADKIVFSGIGKSWGFLMLLCSLFGKKYIYLMHGWLKYEDIMNKTTNVQGEKIEEKIMRNASKILCVSKNFSVFVRSRVSSDVSCKIDFLTNPIDFEAIESLKEKVVEKDSNLIILIGGGRATKRNLQVCMAVNKLNQKLKKKYRVVLFGPPSGGKDLELMMEYDFVSYEGVVNHEKLIQEMQKASLFVQCSELESFSLGVIEALLCGCGILVSKNVGAISILKSISSKDIINDPLDIDEIAIKIFSIMENCNNSEILENLDKIETSVVYAANKLQKIIDKI